MSLAEGMWNKGFERGTRIYKPGQLAGSPMDLSYSQSKYIEKERATVDEISQELRIYTKVNIIDLLQVETIPTRYNSYCRPTIPLNKSKSRNIRVKFILVLLETDSQNW